MDISLGIGKKQAAIRIPDRNLAAILGPNRIKPEKDAVSLIRTALANPIGSPRLAEIVKPGEKVCIITSDITRPVPSALILPFVLDELAKIGIPDSDIEIVFGLGIHRGHTVDEMINLVGEAVYKRIRCVDSDPDRVVNFGRTPTNGTPVDVFEDVARADRRICLGNIEFHYFAGYSGGGKAIMPGVSTRRAIQINHSQMVKPEAIIGEMENNPVRLDIDAAAGMVGVDFILNVVLNEKKDIVFAVAGDFIKAHRVGTRFLDSLYKINIERRADIVLVSPGGFPKDINLYQAQKALDNAKNAVRDGGIIILAAACSEGLGEEVFERWMLGAKTSGQLIRDIQANFEVGGHKAAAIAMVLERAKVFLVSDLPDDFVRKIFFEPFPDLNAALTAAFAKLGNEAKIIVMPHGGSTLPVCG